MCDPVSATIAGSAIISGGIGIISANAQADAQSKQAASAQAQNAELAAEAQATANKAAIANPTQDPSAAVTMQNQRDALTRLRMGLQSTITTSPLGVVGSPNQDPNTNPSTPKTDPSSLAATPKMASAVQPGQSAMNPTSMAIGLKNRLGQ